MEADKQRLEQELAEARFVVDVQAKLQSLSELAPQVGVRQVCEIIGAAQAGYYLWHRQSPASRPEPPKLPTASWTNPPDDTEEATQ